MKSKILGLLKTNILGILYTIFLVSLLVYSFKKDSKFRRDMNMFSCKYGYIEAVNRMLKQGVRMSEEQFNSILNDVDEVCKR